MSVSPQIKRAFFIVWLLIVPAGMWFTYHYYPPHIDGRWPEIFAFAILFGVVAAMPMVINNTPIFLIQWVSLAAFLKFGMFVEMCFAQFAIITLLVKLRLQKDQLYRWPVNSYLFFIVSFGTGIIYYLLGGQIGVRLLSDPKALWLAILYAITNYVINQILVSFHQYVVYKSKESFFGKDFVVETITTMVTFPIGFVLYMLSNYGGLLAFLFVGIPFVSISIIFNLYYSSEKINNYLQKAVEIGHKMAETLQVRDVMDLFIQRLTELMPVDYAYIMEVDGEDLRLKSRIEDSQVMSVDLAPLKQNEGLSGLVWAKQKAFLFSTRKEWKEIISGYFPEDAESVLCVPVVRNKVVTGVVLLASRRKRVYEKNIQMIVDILCSYYAVAIENARHYELTKMQSERCPLTNLYNYRYFENVLSKEFEKLYFFERNQLSLIILDIDHFKAVNDTYGHQSGNEILCELANRLNKLIGGRGTVARYGGEEFVVLLPDINKEEAIRTAELIRQSIANWPFTLTQSMDPDKKQARITASIGVATAPEDAEDALALVRHADRALYVGAKRAGRNRVAEYSNC